MKSIMLKLVCGIPEFLLSSVLIKQVSFYVLEQKQLHKAYERIFVWVAVHKINSH